MDWRNDNAEHARLWNSGVGKVLKRLGTDELRLANQIFLGSDTFAEMAKNMDRRLATQAFISWLVSNFRKEGRLLAEWCTSTHGEEFTPEEKEVLLAGSKSIESVFIVNAQTKDGLTLVDPHGKIFLVGTVDAKNLDLGSSIIARIHSKGGDEYFAPGAIAYEDASVYEEYRKGVLFRDSWSGFLEGFFKHLVSGGLGEKTADRHMDNANVLMIYLEHETAVCSFEGITKPMLKAGFKKFAKKHIFPTPDIDKVYCSLGKFFEYLEEERGIKNTNVLQWLKNR